MDCCRKPYNILTATGLMPSGSSNAGCCMDEIIFPQQNYLIGYTDTVAFSNNCEQDVLLEITLNNTGANEPATFVIFNFGVNTFTLFPGIGAQSVQVPPGNYFDAQFIIENSDLIDVGVEILIYNVTCNIDYGRVIENLSVSYG